MTTRTTVYFDPKLHQALKMKSVQMGISVSEILNQLLLQSLSEDQEDITAFKNRENETVCSYEDFLTEIKADGII